MDFYEAFDLGLCNDCDQDPCKCEANYKCAYSDETNDNINNTEKEVAHENIKA